MHRRADGLTVGTVQHKDHNYVRPVPRLPRLLHQQSIGPNCWDRLASKLLKKRTDLRRYLIYSETDFEVFRPAGATRCTDVGEIWHGGGTFGRSSVPNFTPIGATVRV